LSEEDADFVAAPWRYSLEYAAVASVAATVRTLPRPVSVLFGKTLGYTFYALDRPHRKLTIENLAAAFPNRSPAELRAIARGVFGHFGSLLTEVLRFSGLSREQMLASLEFDGEERVAAAYAHGKGVIFITGHFGYWELQAIGYALRHPPVSVVVRALDNPKLNRLLEDIRTVTGNRVIHRRGGVRKILRALGENQGVALLIDQHINTADAVMVDFFDRPASTTSAVAALALRTGARVLPVFMVPTKNGRYRMIFEHPVEPPAPDSPDALREFTQRCTDVLEMYVRRYPHLWLWMHRRWRDVPRPEVPGMFPAGAAELEEE
jgi:Kdo2-lipid IVA lauroyltransferase/acyltransferase